MVMQNKLITAFNMITLIDTVWAVAQGNIRKEKHGYLIKVTTSPSVVA